MIRNTAREIAIHLSYELSFSDLPVEELLSRRLTPEEYELMKTHAEKGAELLSQIPQMREHAAYRYAYDIALHHHERWDGGGYPHHLVGNQTPIWTQIVSLADVYDALVSKRCYKDALSAQQAVEMISNGQCGAFNPELLHCFRQAEPVLRRFYRPMEEKQHGGGSKEHARGCGHRCR